jgi:hypothetical protein
MSRTVTVILKYHRHKPIDFFLFNLLSIHFLRMDVMDLVVAGFMAKLYPPFVS